MDQNTPYLFGVSSVDMRPPLTLNVRLGGYLRIHKASHGIIDPLKARAICFRHPTDPSKSLLLMSCDIVGFQYRLLKIVRKILSKITQIPIAQIMIHLTHSHSSPDAIGIFPSQLLQFVTTDVQYPVVKYMMGQMIYAGKVAFSNAITSAKIGYGVSAQPKPPFAMQRRPPYAMFEDPLRIIKITDLSDKLLAILVNYQGHPTQLPQVNASLSPEYPGAIADALYKLNPDLQFAAYFNGAIGDVSILGYKGYYHGIIKGKSHEESMQMGIEGVHKLGMVMAKYVNDALDKITTKPITFIACQRRFLFPQIDRSKPILPRLKYYKTLKSKLFMFQKEIINKLRIYGLVYLYQLVNRRPFAILNLKKNGRLWHHQTELYLFRINDIIWFSSPGEPFSIYQKKLFDLVPQCKAFFNSMANDTCGYIFPWSFFVEGGYEITFSYDMLFGEYLFKTFKEELKKIL